MAMTVDDGYLIPRDHDLRTKLDKNDYRKIRILREIDPIRWSQRALAREFNVSRRLITFVLDPSKLKANIERRHERGDYHTATEKQTIYMRKHRAHKRDLLNKGLLIKKLKEDKK